MDPFADVTDHRLTRPDGRVVAWSEWGDPDGRPLLRVPGTPGSRYSIRADRTPWRERGLRVITTERPGYGASTPLPGRGFGEHADDVAAILDHVGLDRVHMVGGSGSAPHELMICQRHGGRIAAATILVGIAPMEENEIHGMVPLNQAGRGGPPLRLPPRGRDPGRAPRPLTRRQRARSSSSTKVGVASR